jgi:glutamine cyclotransferase
MRASLLIACLAVALLPAGCQRDRESAGTAAAQSATSSVIKKRIEVIRTFAHDTTSYTQGLVFHGGFLYESNGRTGRSSLEKIDPATGKVLLDVAVPDVFAEGLAAVGNHLILLTWHERRAFVYDIASFRVIREHSYNSDGWGICSDGESLYMTTGQDTIYRRHPDTFELLGKVAVRKDGYALAALNELECVGESIFANLYPTDGIVEIDKRTGKVLAEIDGSALMPQKGRRDFDSVLNGIAYDPASQTFYLTGKLWSSMFQVRFITP